jgi:hypothetical protein
MVEVEPVASCSVDAFIASAFRPLRRHIQVESMAERSLHHKSTGVLACFVSLGGREASRPLVVTTPVGGSHRCGSENCAAWSHLDACNTPSVEDHESFTMPTAKLAVILGEGGDHGFNDHLLVRLARLLVRDI